MDAHNLRLSISMPCLNLSDINRQNSFSVRQSYAGIDEHIPSTVNRSRSTSLSEKNRRSISPAVPVHHDPFEMRHRNLCRNYITF